MKTRAQVYGLKAGVIARQAKRRVQKAKDLLMAAGALYEDINGCLEVSLREAIGGVDAFEEEIDATTEYLNEQMER